MEVGTNAHGGVMPRYRFHWSNVPRPVLDALTGPDTPPGSDPVEVLTGRYGARPKAAFVADLWPVLREDWLAFDESARRAVVDALRSRGLGDSGIEVGDRDSDREYLRSVRNNTSLREIVVERFWLLGEHSDHSAATEGSSTQDRPTTADATPAASIPPSAEPLDDSPVLDAGELSDDFQPVAITPARPWADLAASPGQIEDDGPRRLQGLRASLMMDPEWTAEEPRTTWWWGGPAPLTITAGDPRECFGDPTVKITASVTVVDQVQVDEDQALAFLSARNMMASTGSLTLLHDEGRVVASCTHYAHPGDAGMAQLFPGYVLMMYTEALALIGQGALAEVLRGRPGVFPHPVSGVREDYDELVGTTDEIVVPRGSEPNAYSGDEFNETVNTLVARNLFATGDDHGLTVELPWSSGVPAAVASMVGKASQGRTAMMQVLRQQHPGYGTGLLCLLFLPELLSTKEARVRANALNRAELVELTGFPSLGAWTARDADGGESRVVHATFLPNAYARPGMVQAVASFGYMRSQWAQERLLPADVVERVRSGTEPLDQLE